jgi:hypothetical protein
LLHYKNNLIKTRDEQGLLTHTGKVKSHTSVIYNDEANGGARGVIDGYILQDVTFTADVPLSGASEHGPR